MSAIVVSLTLLVVAAAATVAWLIRRMRRLEHEMADMQTALADQAEATARLATGSTHQLPAHGQSRHRRHLRGIPGGLAIAAPVAWLAHRAREHPAMASAAAATVLAGAGAVTLPLWPGGGDGAQLAEPPPAVAPASPVWPTVPTPAPREVPSPGPERTPPAEAGPTTGPPGGTAPPAVNQPPASPAGSGGSVTGPSPAPEPSPEPPPPSPAPSGEPPATTPSPQPESSPEEEEEPEDEDEEEEDGLVCVTVDVRDAADVDLCVP